MNMTNIIVPIIVFAFLGGIMLYQIKLYWKYNNYSINEKALQIKIKGETIRFKDIANITVDGNIRNLSVREYLIYGGKYKDLAPIVFDRINFELKNGEVKYLETRYRERCYKVLKTLSKYKIFHFDLNEYKPPLLYPFDYLIIVLAFLMSNHFYIPVFQAIICILFYYIFIYICRNYWLK